MGKKVINLLRIFRKLYFIISLITVILSINIYSQEFQVEPLISIPGDNINFSVTSHDLFQFQETYICWENKFNSIYSIYLRKIDTISDQIYKVCSDTNRNTNPVISYNSQNDSLVIVWQLKEKDHWCLKTCGFKNGKFSSARIITDTLVNSICPVLGNQSLSWIENGKLLNRQYFLNTNITDTIMVVDSINCSNPKMTSNESSFSPYILYEKGDSMNKQIYTAEYIGQIREQNPYWRITKISTGQTNENPSFGTVGDIAYQTMVDNKWRIVYPDFYSGKNIESKNVSCNFQDPMVFKYYILTKCNSDQNLGYFVVFDTDSLLNNREILINYTPSGNGNDTNMNISNSPGDDSEPYVVYLNAEDSSHVAIIWEHGENNKTDIWWALTDFHLSTSDVTTRDLQEKDFCLNQNYPNPFNPSTTIRYEIPKENNVTIKIFDVLGREVETLINAAQKGGEHEVVWNAKNFSSGIYFYQIRAGELVSTKKMLLIK